MTKDQDTNLNNSGPTVINHNRKPQPSGKKTGSSTRRPRSLVGCTEAGDGGGGTTSSTAEATSPVDDFISTSHSNAGNNKKYHDIALDDLGASALLPSKKSTILGPHNQNNNSRKKLQLQFSFQERSDDEENDDESVFLDQPAGPTGPTQASTSLLSDDEDDEMTTSPSLTFGVVDSCSRKKADYRPLYRQSSADHHSSAQADNSAEIVGGTRKKSRNNNNRSKKKPSPTAVAVVTAGTAAGTAIRIENGEIRPLRNETSPLNEEDEEIEDNRTSAENGAPRRSSSKHSRRKRSDNPNDKVMPPAQNSNGGNAIPAGCVGGPSITKMEKDAELNHIIPESKKFPQIAAAVSVSTGCISYGICIAYTSPALPSILELNHTTSLTNILGDEETSWMSSLLALGALFGSLSAVYLMDAVGRKASLLAFSVMSLFIGWTLLMAASQVWQLYTGRFLLGLGAGMEITICPVYIHEICRPALRDVCGSFPQVFIALGILLCYIMGRSLEWNWLALAACLFLFPFVFGLYFIPESPPWLIYNDEEDLAYKSMLMIRGEEYDASVEICRIKDNLARHKNDLHAMLLESVDYMAENTNTDIGNNSSILELQPGQANNGGAAAATGEHNSGSRKSSSAISARSTYQKFGFTDVFQKSILYPFLVILVLMFLLQFSGQGTVTFYTASIFEKAESSVDPNDCALVIGVTYFLSSILGLVLKKHVGRRILLLASELGMAISQLAMGIYFYVLDRTSTDDLKNSHSGLRMLPLPILIIFTLAFNVGMGSLTWVVATEILPVRSRRWTHTVANVTSNLCWFVVTKTYGDISTRFGTYVPFFIYGSVCLFGFVFIYVFLPETRGKTPEETAKAFRGWGPLMKRTGCRSLFSSKMCDCCCCFQDLQSVLRNSDHSSTEPTSPTTMMMHDHKLNHVNNHNKDDSCNQEETVPPSK